MEKSVPGGLWILMLEITVLDVRAMLYTRRSVMIYTSLVEA